ncbi:hypothetical protein, partial [Streptomyces sp. P17]|uniref:hypothetical protein n=1 Tax=Streptomyces sp. P17 TaxID=3074716 RepID=UPI0028F42ED7
DVKTVEYLIGLMAKHELTEIALQEGEQKIRLRKGSEIIPTVAAAPATPVAAVAAAPAVPAAATPAAPAKKLLEIKS